LIPIVEIEQDRVTDTRQEGTTMNTMTELLLTDLHDARIAERHAAADARRLASSVRPQPRPARTWSLAAVVGTLSFRRRAARPL
jgi:hypothetical protein